MAFYQTVKFTFISDWYDKQYGMTDRELGHIRQQPAQPVGRKAHSWHIYLFTVLRQTC